MPYGKANLLLTEEDKEPLYERSDDCSNKLRPQLINCYRKSGVSKQFFQHKAAKKSRKIAGRKFSI